MATALVLAALAPACAVVAGLDGLKDREPDASQSATDAATDSSDVSDAQPGAGDGSVDGGVADAQPVPDDGGGADAPSEADARSDADASVDANALDAADGFVDGSTDASVDAVVDASPDATSDSSESSDAEGDAHFGGDAPFDAGPGDGSTFEDGATGDASDAESTDAAKDAAKDGGAADASDGSADASSPDAADAAGPTADAGTTVITCGSGNCEPGEVCCVVSGPSFFEQTCATTFASCPVPPDGGAAVSLRCNSDVDCASGDKCCISKTDAGVTSACDSSCAAGASQLCNPYDPFTNACPLLQICSGSNIASWDLPTNQTYATCGGQSAP